MLQEGKGPEERELLLEGLQAFRQGVSDAPLLRKWTEESTPDAGKNQSGDGTPPMVFVLSTDDVDRHGDVISANGWKLDSYRANPVFLWAHDYARPAIGRSVDTWMEPHRLMGRVEFAPFQFAQEVAGLYQSGYQRGVSVGFKPLKYEERRHEKTGAFLGIRFLEQELLEVSAVPVPANRQALRRALNDFPWAAGLLHRAGAAGDVGEGSAPGLLAALEATWPVISARIDDLTELTGELACLVDGLRIAAPPSLDGPQSVNGPQSENGATIEELLEALRALHLATGPGANQPMPR